MDSEVHVQYYICRTRKSSTSWHSPTFMVMCLATPTRVILMQLVDQTKLNPNQWASLMVRKLCVDPKSTSTWTDVPFRLYAMNRNMHGLTCNSLVCTALTNWRLLRVDTSLMKGNAYSCAATRLRHARSRQLALWCKPMQMWQLVHFGSSSCSAANVWPCLVLSPLGIIELPLLHPLPFMHLL